MSAGTARGTEPRIPLESIENPVSGASAVAITREQIEAALDTIINPDTGKSYLAAKNVKAVKVDGSAVVTNSLRWDIDGG